MGKTRQIFKAITDSPLGDVVANRIRNKLALGMLAVGLVPLFVLGLALYQASVSIIQVQSPDLLEPVKVTMWNVFLIVALGASVLILIISLMLSGSLTRQTDAIMEMLSSIGIGDFSARAEVVSRDELGTVAESLNSMCDNTLTLIQSREERDAIQQDIQILMQEVSEIAAGDLRIESNVNREITGGIADAINFMISQLRDVVRRVKRATDQVSHSTHDIRSTTEHLSRGTEAQAAQILDTSSAIDEMSLSIGQVADNTDESAVVARQARESAHKGTLAVQDTIQGMNRIRDQVQDSAKRIKRLGESSQEIGEIVQLISDIADRTSILALNASIQAAMAGDAGQGFAVVAEEVERLAERSNEATKQIAALIKAIQGETSEAISAMEESTREVVAGSTLAVQAGEALEEIDEVSSRLDELDSQHFACHETAGPGCRSLVEVDERNLRRDETDGRRDQAGGEGHRRIGRPRRGTPRLRECVQASRRRRAHDAKPAGPPRGRVDGVASARQPHSRRVRPVTEIGRRGDRETESHRMAFRSLWSTRHSLLLFAWK